MNQTQLAPEINDTNLSGRWMTVIFNDDHTPMDLVVLTIMVATRCDTTEAEIETWEAHTYGKAPIHFASEAECNQVASVIRTIGVKTEVCLEWED
ncbi:MAG: ATP-dependent Clp protease adaptor ClpS [Armatimonadota bacterium]